MSLRLPEDLSDFHVWELTWLAAYAEEGVQGLLRGAPQHYRNLRRSLDAELERRVADGSSDAAAITPPDPWEFRRTETMPLLRSSSVDDIAARYLERLLSSDWYAVPHEKLDHVVRRIWATTRRTPWCETPDDRCDVISRRTVDVLLRRIWKKVRSQDPRQVLWFLQLRAALPHTLPFCIAYD